MPTKRILIVGHTYVVSENQGKIKALLKAENIKVGLLLPNEWVSSEWGIKHHFKSEVVGLNVYTSPVYFNGRSGAYVFPYNSIFNAFNDFKPDIIHVEQEVFSLVAFQIALFANFINKPLTVFCWENVDRKLHFLRRFTRKYVLARSKVIVAGNAGAKILLRKWHYDGEINVLPQLGIDIPKKILHKTRNSPPIIGYFGRLVYEKGIDILLSAAQLMQTRGVRCKLTIVGIGDAQLELHNLARLLGIEHLIIWKEPVLHEDVLNEMNKVDIVVLPSRSTAKWKEQFGHVLIEAMAIGVPVVGSDCGEIPVVIGREDLLFRENNVIELADICTRLFSDDGFYSEVSNYCKSKVQNEFTNDVIANKLSSIWKSI